MTGMFSKIFSKEQIPNWLIVFKLIGSYIILSLCFKIYVGILNPGGTLYFPLLSKFSLIDGILFALVYPCIAILKLLGFTTKHSQNMVGVTDGITVFIQFACLGIKIMIAYTSLLIAFPGRKKIIFWVLGLIAIHCLNILRIVAIIVGFSHDRRIVHLTHDMFNYFGYACVCLFFYYWYTKHGYFSKSNIER